MDSFIKETEQPLALQETAVKPFAISKNSRYIRELRRSMNQRFDNVLKSLAEDAEKKLEQWTREVKELTDVRARQVGERVLENLQNDEQFEDSPYREFLEALSESAPSEACNKRYRITCRDFHKIDHSPNTVFASLDVKRNLVGSDRFRRKLAVR